MNHTDELSNYEQGAVEEMQERMRNELPVEMLQDVALLCRFLKARDFDVEKAVAMLRNDLIWRKSFQVDSILEDFKPKEFYTKHIQPSCIGYDKNGDIVLYSPWGNMQVSEIYNCVKINHYMKHWVWYMEYLKRKIKKEKKNVKYATLIIDLDHLSFTNVTNKYAAEYCSRLLRIFSDHYPETLKALFLINAPGYYVLIFSLLRPLMSKAMQRKVHVFSNNGYKEKLVEFIDADVLPAFLGGNRTDPDGNPLCKTFVHHGGGIPEKYFMPDDERWSFRDASRVKKVIVHARQQEEIFIDATDDGSLIHWEFLINGKDIGFGLLFRGSDQETLKEILPIQRFDTIDGTEVGWFRTQSTGTYIIIFDNSHSWMTSKKVEYCITVEKRESRSLM